MTSTPELRTASFGTPAETSYGYTPALRWGDTVYVSGCTASPLPGEPDAPADAEGQLRRAYAKIARALEQVGAAMGDVVDEVLYAADVAAIGTAAGKVRHEVYGGTPRVASTLVGVTGLAGPGLLVEIKCIARVAT